MAFWWAWTLLWQISFSSSSVFCSYWIYLFFNHDLLVCRSPEYYIHFSIHDFLYHHRDGCNDVLDWKTLSEVLDSRFTFIAASLGWTHKVGMFSGTWNCKIIWQLSEINLVLCSQQFHSALSYAGLRSCIFALCFWSLQFICNFLWSYEVFGPWIHKTIENPFLFYFPPGPQILQFRVKMAKVIVKACSGFNREIRKKKILRDSNHPPFTTSSVLELLFMRSTSPARLLPSPLHQPRTFTYIPIKGRCEA